VYECEIWDLARLTKRCAGLCNSDGEGHREGIGWVRSWTDFMVIGKGPDTAKVAGRSLQDE
jgi:hypothetical protein